MKPALVFLLFATLGATALAQSGAPPAAPPKLEVPYSQFTLANGLR